MYKIIVLALTLCCLSCYNVNRPDKPDNLIAKEKMVSILYDIALVSSAKGINRRELENKGVNVSQFVYHKYNIDSAQFAESNMYYATDPKEYKTIYDSVQSRLEATKAKYKILEKEEKRQDSIVQAKRKDSLAKLDADKDKVVKQLGEGLR